MKRFSEALVPGAHLVDIIPVLKYLPAWLPGMGFKSIAKNEKRIMFDQADKPYHFVKQQMSNGSASPSFVSGAIRQKGSKLSAEDEEDIKWSASSIFGGGADTTVATTLSVIRAMSIWPEVQIKAREELDRVVGTARLPTIADRDNLPYLNAIVQEAFRWHTIAPLGSPHTAKNEDVYEGYRIPKGAMIIPATWWFTHDPEVYHDPMEFKPERFLEPFNEPDPTNFAFGYGRRICPGRLMADATIYILVAKTLAAFEIQKEVDLDGNEIEPVVEFEGGLISQLRPFDCRISVRTKGFEELIRRVDVEHPWVKGSDMEELEKI
jgi:cytochrome P450